MRQAAQLLRIAFALNWVHKVTVLDHALNSASKHGPGDLSARFSVQTALYKSLKIRVYLGSDADG